MEMNYMRRVVNLIAKGLLKLTTQTKNPDINTGIKNNN